MGHSGARFDSSSLLPPELISGGVVIAEARASRNCTGSLQQRTCPANSIAQLISFRACMRFLLRAYIMDLDSRILYSFLFHECSVLLAREFGIFVYQGQACGVGSRVQCVLRISRLVWDHFVRGIRW